MDRCRGERQAIVSALAELDAISVQGAVPDLQAALRAIATSAPDVVVTGVELADASALELIEVARQGAPSPRIVVVAASPTRDVWRRHLAAGADHFVERDAELHELREVLGSLAHHADGREHELRLLLAGVRATVERADRMTASVLAYVRGEPPVVDLLDLGLVVRAALARVLPSLPPEIAVRADLADRVPPIRGSSGELELLVLSLAFDAADSMPDGGSLVVRVQSTSTSAVYLEVSYRGTFGTRVPGSGLELARRVVERHGGSIRHATRDSGSVAVTVFLPSGR
ncbi:MAG: response regulator [Acidobacteriota bacterium]